MNELCAVPLLFGRNLIPQPDGKSEGFLFLVVIVHLHARK